MVSRRVTGRDRLVTLFNLPQMHADTCRWTERGDRKPCLAHFMRQGVFVDLPQKPRPQACSAREMSSQ